MIDACSSPSCIIFPFYAHNIIEIQISIDEVKKMDARKLMEWLFANAEDAINVASSYEEKAVFDYESEQHVASSDGSARSCRNNT